MSSAIHAAIAARDPDALSAAIYDEMIPVIPSATDPVTWDPRELGSSGGNVFKAVAWQDKLWWRDNSSTASADGLTCIILLDGGHYLTNDVTFPGVVESRELATPSDADGDDPTVIGKAWRIPADGSGAWAGHDDDVAMGSARGWQFHTPEVGEEHYVRDELKYESFTDDNVWETRVSDLGDASVLLSNIGWDGRVQNQTTNTQPTTISKGTAHIIGPSPTGAKWAGNAGKLSISETDNDVTVYTPWVGMTVYDIALGYDVKWTGTAWVSAAGVWVGRTAVLTPGSGSVTAVAGTTFYSYASGSSPATSNRIFGDAATATHQAKRAGAKLKIKWQGDVSIVTTTQSTTAGEPCIALFRDSETTAIAVVRMPLSKVLLEVYAGPNRMAAEFFVDAVDASSHIYKVCLTSWRVSGVATYDVGSIENRSLEVLEAA